MFSRKTLDAARVTVAGLSAVMATAGAGVTAHAAPGAQLFNQISSAAMRAESVGRTAPTQQINIAIALHLRNEQNLDAEIKSLYDPSSPNYHKFLSSDEFNAKYAPSAADYAAVIAYAQRNGLTVTGTHANRQIIDLAAPASTVENTFSVHLLNRVLSDGRHCYAADANPSIPNELSGAIRSVVGLDNAAQFTPHMQGLTALDLSKVSPRAGSGPSGLLEPNDIRKAYNLNNVTQDGTGQTLALFELDGYAVSDIQMYENQFGLPNVPLQNVLIDGYSGGPGNDGGNVEVCLDIELMAALAPKASKIMVYEAPNSGQGVLDEYAKIASDNIAKSVSSSWGMSETYSSSAYLQAEQNSFRQMAAQGQSMYAAAGDSGAYDAGTSLAVDDPASQPYVCGVGGTSLYMTSSQAYTSEATWGTGGSSSGGGGGKSVVWPKPSYQTGLGLSKTMREVPDVSLDSDPNTGYVISCNGGWYALGGTSCAAPLWAGFTALVDQARASNGQAPLGFPNPTIYTLAQTPLFFSDFHDIADNSTNRYYPAIPGYDDATGWGSFNGGNLLADLATGATFTPNSPAPPTNVTASIGSSSTIVSWTASAGATEYNVLRSSATVGPYFLIGTSTTVNYTDTSAGTGSSYTYVVSAQNSNGISGISNISGTSNGASSIPTGLTVSSIGLTNCNLNVNAVNGASNYVVGKATTSGGPYTTVSSPPTNATTIVGLAQATTYYFVEAAKVNGVQSAWSAEAPCTTRLDSPNNNISCAPNTAGTGIVVTWGSVAAAKGYTLKRSLSGSGPFATVATTTTALTYTDSSIQPGVTYWYLVDATAGSVTSYDSRIVETSAGTSAPKNLTASYTGTSVNLQCTQSTGATSYNYLRSTKSGGPYTQIGTSPNNGYQDKALTAGTTYYYVAQAVNGKFTSGNSNQASAMTAPPAPTALTGTASTSGVALKWNFQTGVTATFSVQRSNSTSGQFAQVGTTSALTLTDTGAARGTTYYYRIVASNSAGTSPPSNVHTITTTPAAPARPSAPTLKISGSSVLVSWSALSGATGYKLYRGTSPSYSYGVIASPTATSYTDSAVTPGVNYVYYLCATGPGGTSDNGQASTITVPLSAPSAVTATANGTGSATIKWAASKGATSYGIVYATKSGGPYGGGTPGTSTSATSTTISGLQSGTTYYFIVTAYAPGSSSPGSNQVSATTSAPGTTGNTKPAPAPSTGHVKFR